MPLIQSIVLVDDLLANRTYNRLDMKVFNGESVITLNESSGGELHTSKILEVRSRRLSDGAVRNKVKFDFPFVHDTSAEGYNLSYEQIEHELLTIDARMNPRATVADRADHIARIQSFVASADFVDLMSGEGIW